MGRTTFPGWYVNFQAAVLMQLPRPDQIDQVTGEGWTKNQDALNKALAGVILPSTKEVKKMDDNFFFIKQFNLTVPPDYVHTTRLDSFAKANKAKFYGYNENITNKNFAKVSHQLVQGKTYMVKLFGIKSVVSSDDCLTVYRANKAYYTGAQGASVVWGYKRKELIKGKWNYSFDVKTNLPVVDGYHRVPCVHALSNGDFSFNLGTFEAVWSDYDVLVLFCDCDE